MLLSREKLCISFSTKLLIARVKLRKPPKLARRAKSDKVVKDYLKYTSFYAKSRENKKFKP